MIYILNSQKDRELKIRLLVVNLLRELKNSYTYKELSSIFNIQESLLCRYVNGNTIPSESHSRDILDKIKSKEFLSKFLADKIIKYDDGFIDTSKMLFYPNLLKLLIEMFYHKYFGNRDEIDKIVTVAVNGIPFAAIASEAIAKPLIIIKKHKDSVHISYIDENIKESEGMITSIYLRKDFVYKGEKVLVVDDVIRSGKTIYSTFRLIQKADAKVIGALVLVGVGKEWSKISNTFNIPIIPIFSL